MSTSQAQSKMRIKRGDTVRVLLGKDRGKKGVVQVALPAQDRVIVEGVNVMKKHVRPRRAGEKGQRVAIAAPMPVSNVQLICPACKKGTRVGLARKGEQMVRVCKQCEASIPNPSRT